ncbi:E1 ubiquitin-activating protein uba2 [Coemansia sp. RSA 552]|nr:E1 ubiquitin-activating protein uba2 [Coemansia sp. RSA 552]
MSYSDCVTDFGPVDLSPTERVSSARVLVVGAGGIGCELLKDLSMSGFRHIHAIDLDTIDLSNLNRQFLFQRKHIKRPKAAVAIQAISRFNPGIDATAHQANIKDPEYDVDWFAGFDLVLNALDNLDARRHVNTMCLAAHVPLVESGTAGYLGQVTVINGGATECFECQPKAAERKTYPVCTIRSTPTAPIHCIVWAKDYLFAQLFGERADDGDDEGMAADEKAENMLELAQLRKESQALSRLAEAMGSPDFARAVFEKVFVDDVVRLLTMKDMWKQRRPPTPLDFADLQARTRTGFDPAHPDDQAVLPIEDAFSLFVFAADKLARRIVGQSPKDGLAAQRGFLSFDKDDEDALSFVAATANLRSQVFGIEQKSIFAIKAMAGNIIPAIATTNAIVAGMMVVQAILVLSRRVAECHTAYVSYGSKRPRYIIREPLSKPNPRCPVCRRRYLTLRVADCSQTTLGDVLAYVNGPDCDLGLGEDIAVVEASRILYDPDFDDNLAKPLAELGLVPGKAVTLTSEDDDEVVPVILSIAVLRPQGASPQRKMAIEGIEQIPEFEPLPPRNTASDGHASDTMDNEDDMSVDTGGAIVLDDDDKGTGNVTSPHADHVNHISEELTKRKLNETGTASENAPKRRATSDDDSDGDIVALE